MRLAIAIFLIAACATAATRGNPRVREYRHQAVGKRTLIGSAAGAGVAQVRNSPAPMGPRRRRFRRALRLARRASTSPRKRIQFGVAAAHHENLHYQPSTSTERCPRMGYAVKHTFIVPKTNKRGKKTVALGPDLGQHGSGNDLAGVDARRECRRGCGQRRYRSGRGRRREHGARVLAAQAQAARAARAERLGKRQALPNGVADSLELGAGPRLPGDPETDAGQCGSGSRLCTLQQRPQDRCFHAVDTLQKI